jgi:ParB-like chromosome segregation protein Spo0J
MLIKIEDVKVSADFYPRQKRDDLAIQRYRDSIDSLPPIVVALVNGDYLLVDGFHRTLAYKSENLTEIEAVVRDDLTSASAVLAEAIRLNATHGLQLPRADKERLAQQLYGQYTNEQLEKLLAVAQLSFGGRGRLW